MFQETAQAAQENLASAIDHLARAIEASGAIPAVEGAAGAAGQGATDAGQATPGDGASALNDLGALQQWLLDAKDKLIDYLPTLIAAIAILVVGWFIARFVTNLVRKAMRRGKVDETLAGFLAHMVYMALMAFVVISAITKLGVSTASFVAILGAASFAVGFAMQGSLSNFAAGVMLMIFRPMRKGDLVEAGGVLGTVEEVGVFATIIHTLENKRAILANSTVTDGNIINYSANGKLRVDMTFGIGYEDDIDEAIATMEEILAADPRVLKDPAPTVALFEHGDSSVNFVCRPYVEPAHYWDVWFDTHKAVKKAFDAKGISIPFPQRDVHLFQASA